MTVTDARKGFALAIKRAAMGDPVVVTRHGRPIVAVVAASDLAILEIRIRMQERAKEAARRIVAVLPSCRLVVLFGSCARGEPNSRSDIDIVVVADLDEEAYWSAWDALSAALADMRVDLMLVRPDEWELAGRSSALGSAKREGIVLHAG